ncbi:alpha/beta fold hydrolase [Pseudacidobacterium ailaaui]|jgi:pimeloyl-ACP methyl ester carboxylesterase|uniref:alpha/beta fold hydrolase n=1 Tax=Pseudacidobacterium ailaaui TaxID=1382359 RepID=UPI0006793B4E|nr:alpha/beta fold hydrolase [Pseudacidobacterium ailaaui]
MALATWMLAEGPPVEREVRIHGHLMHCLVAGSGPSLLLIHGLLGSAEAWVPCLPRLAEDSTVYAVDTLNIGRSDRVSGLDASLSAQADRMARFMGQAGIHRADVLGTSHGGAIALMLAARHPELVRSLLLHAPANPFSNIADPLLHFYRTPLGRWFAHQLPYLPTGLQELALGRMYGNRKHPVRDEVLELYMRSLKVLGTIDHVLNILECWFDDMHQLKAALKQIREIPVQLIWGTRDRAVSMASGKVLKKNLPQAEMAILPGVGHLPFEEAPGAFAEVVNTFLRKLDRSEARPGPQLVRS